MTAEVGYRFCGSCGKKFREGCLKCPYCGNAIKGPVEPTVDPNVHKTLISVEFSEANGKIYYSFKNGKNEDLRIGDISDYFTLPLISAIEKFLWKDFDICCELSEEDLYVWRLNAFYKVRKGNPTAFSDAYNELVEKKKFGPEFG